MVVPDFCRPSSESNGQPSGHGRRLQSSRHTHLADEGLDGLVDLVIRVLELGSHAGGFLCKTHVASCRRIEQCACVVLCGVRTNQVLQKRVGGVVATKVRTTRV